MASMHYNNIKLYTVWYVRHYTQFKSETSTHSIVMATCLKKILHLTVINYFS